MAAPAQPTPEQQQQQLQELQQAQLAQQQSPPAQQQAVETPVEDAVMGSDNSH